ncbi:MAG: response regulator, partial [Halobacteriovoraceae bacterium]|nr:response regulator [Halobacteriovoraceae bacterium]
MKVLYADSDTEVRDYVSMLLEAGLDCEILEASSGNEALSILEFEEDIDFVISEVHMKGGDGNIIVNYLDNNAMIVPIVWLSEKKNQKESYVKEVVGRSALNAFVPKPFRDDQFFPVIDKILTIKSDFEAKGIGGLTSNKKTSD